MSDDRPTAVVCPECGRLVARAEVRCPFCGAGRPAGGGVEGLLRGLFRIPFERIVIPICAVLFLFSLALDPSGVRFDGIFRALSPSPESLLFLGASGAIPVFGLGRWWTLLSATWLHGGLIHILFNMLWVRHLSPAVVGACGPARTVLIYVFSGACGFVLSSLMGAMFGSTLPVFLRGAQLTIGASASVFGLLGAIVYFDRRYGFGIAARQAWTWALVLFFMGFVMWGIDNYAHLGGFVGGYAGARLVDALQPERPAHRLAAAAALLASLGAVGISFVASRSLIGL